MIEGYSDQNQLERDDDTKVIDQVYQLDETQDLMADDEWNLFEWPASIDCEIELLPQYDDKPYEITYGEGDRYFDPFLCDASEHKMIRSIGFRLLMKTELNLKDGLSHQIDMKEDGGCVEIFHFDAPAKSQIKVHDSMGIVVIPLGGRLLEGDDLMMVKQLYGRVGKTLKKESQKWETDVKLLPMQHIAQIQSVNVWDGQSKKNINKMTIFDFVKDKGISLTLIHKADGSEQEYVSSKLNVQQNKRPSMTFDIVI